MSRVRVLGFGGLFAASRRGGRGRWGTCGWLAVRRCGEATVVPPPPQAVGGVDMAEKGRRRSGSNSGRLKKD
jgi:hypothetical protein